MKRFSGFWLMFSLLLGCSKEPSAEPAPGQPIFRRAGNPGCQVDSVEITEERRWYSGAELFPGRFVLNLCSEDIGGITPKQREMAIQRIAILVKENHFAMHFACNLKRGSSPASDNRLEELRNRLFATFDEAFGPGKVLAFSCSFGWVPSSGQ